jgi:hypothetical protein
MALQVGTPVQTSDGHTFGTVEHVLQDPELDLFDGIVVSIHHGLRFVDRDQIEEITTTRVSYSIQLFRYVQRHGLARVPGGVD